MSYNLAVLNDKEFEDLAKELLERELGLKFENFKTGKDNGIDLRCAVTQKNEIIVQVKHLSRSKFSDLKYQIVNEKEKLDRLTNKPKRYIVFTSLPLNPIQTDELESILSPYLLNTGDIYSYDSVQSLISKYPEVETKFNKLWLTSSNVLSQILHNAQNVCSEFMEEKIIKRSKFFVETDHFSIAHNFLSNNKIIIISGEPGVGKTTLAYMLTYKFLAIGFQLLYSDRNIRDVEDQLSRDRGKKQIVLIDDFLGSSIAEINNTNNTDNTLVRFLEQIKVSPNKYLILTTRSTILNEAVQKYEKFEKEELRVSSTYELKVSEYSDIDKAKILYNHLFHCEISSEFRKAFLIDKNYLSIIQHANYYPRLIEFLTQETMFKKSGHNFVSDFIIENLKNPKEIWKYAFTYQLNRLDQILLETLFTFGDGGTDVVSLEIAFNQRVDTEKKNRGVIIDIDPFNNTLRKMQEIFLKMDYYGSIEKTKIRFINPSVTDFLLDFLRTNNSEKKQIWESVIYIEQLENRFQYNDIIYLGYRKQEESYYLNIFLTKMNGLLTAEENLHFPFRILNFIRRMFPECLHKIQSELNLLLSQLDGNWIEVIDLYFIIDEIRKCHCEDTLNFIRNNWEYLISVMIKNAIDLDNFKVIVDLFEDFNENFKDVLKTGNFKEIVDDLIISTFKDDIMDFDGVEAVIQEINIDSNTLITDQDIRIEMIKVWEEYLREENILSSIGKIKLPEYVIEEILENFFNNLEANLPEIEIIQPILSSNSKKSYTDVINEIESIFSK